MAKLSPKSRYFAPVSLALFVVVAISWVTGNKLVNNLRHLNNDRAIFSESNLVEMEPTSATSPACQPRFPPQPHTIKRIFFAHTRKAGGSFLRRVLKSVRNKYGLRVKVVEGYPVETPKRRNTLYITTLRHPVERALSHYRYSERWPCKQMLFNKSFVPTAENSATLEDFIDSGELRGDNSDPCTVWEDDDDAPRLWTCASNCYLRWFGEPFNCVRNITQSYESARKNLYEGFHIVVVTEWLKDSKYKQGLLRMLGLGKKREFDSDMYCYEVSKKNNAKFPAIIRNETLTRLHNRNEQDVKLYQHLTTCPEGVQFPKTTLRKVMESCATSAEAPAQNSER